MADQKISALSAASLPLAGTEVLPIVQSGATVKVANNDLRPKQIQSNATSGVLQVAGPAAASTRVMTTPDANFTAARTDAAQTFSGTQSFSGTVEVGRTQSNYSVPAGSLAQGKDLMFASATDNVANGGTLALNPGANRFIGFVTVASVNSANAAIRQQTTFSAFIFDGDATSIQQISTADGSGGGSAFTLAWVNNTGFQVTNNAGASRSVYIWISGQWIG